MNNVINTSPDFDRKVNELMKVIDRHYNNEKEITFKFDPTDVASLGLIDVAANFVRSKLREMLKQKKFHRERLHKKLCRFLKEEQKVHADKITANLLKLAKQK